jgi:Immunoglobulin-like domain of bacterial spore germination/Sporulation and spore germination
MSDERRDDEIIGRALSRAIETIDVNQTPFERSRIATAPARRSLFGLWQIATAAAAIVLALAIGSWLTRPTDGQPGVAASPSASVGGATPSPTATPSPAVASPNTDRVWVYFARDSLPPIGTYVVGASLLDTSPESRIASRITALGIAAAKKEAPSGATNLLAHDKSGGIAVRVQGDLATVEFDGANAWDVHGSAASLALVQQLVYTITEEPGIHRAMITERGKPNAIIDQLMVDKPLSREDVFGYADAAKPDKIDDGGMGAVGEIADWRASVDQVAPGLGRFVVEFKPQPGAPANSTPNFVVRLERPASEKRQEDGKWVLRVTLPDGLWNQPTGEAFHCCPLKVVGKTPIIEVAAYPLNPDASTGATYKGVGFAIVLDDARPWRAMVLQNPTRLVVDVGGPTQFVSDRIAVYQLLPGAPAAREVQVTGAARVFEASVSWRLKDQSGREVGSGHFLASLGSSAVWGTFDARIAIPASLTGPGTLELFEASARDGTPQGLVAIPLGVR